MLCLTRTDACEPPGRWTAPYKKESAMQKSTQTKYVGVDVSKRDLFVAIGEKTRRFANDPEQCAALIKTVGTHAHIVCEATGGYEQCLVEAAHAAGAKVSVLMPKRVRYYACAAGLLAKNDKIDAQLITRYACAMKPQAQPKLDVKQIELRELMRARNALVAQITQLTNQCEHLSGVPLLAELAKAHMSLLKEHLKMIEGAIHALIESTEVLRQKAERIQQIKGVGIVSARIIIAEMPHLGSLEHGQAASALGVAPHPRDSGQYRGKRFVFGGNARVRSVLYMAAVCASQNNPILRSFYTRLLARGKPAKVALVAVMRKLIELINRLLKFPDFILA